MTVSDIGDVADFEAVASLAKNLEGNIDSKRVSTSESAAGMISEGNSSKALQRAVNAFAMSSGTGVKNNVKNDDVENNIEPKPRRIKRDAIDDDNMEDEVGQRKRRPIPDDFFGGDQLDEEGMGSHMEDEEEGGDDTLVESIAKQKKAFRELKKQHYVPEPKYGGLDDEIAATRSPSDKRAASYEIIANRGLTPHRKKANRNPRVKKREAYQKAIIARKGQVREVISGASGSYGGETTGIKANLGRSRKITN